VKRQIKITLATVIITLALLCPAFYFASSAGIKIIDSTLSPGGLSTSSNFQISGAISQISIGPGQSANFNLKAGWLYFPLVNTPIISASAGNGQVALSWTPAVGTLGWSVAGYSVGWSANSGGPYNNIDVGASTSYTKTGLTGSSGVLSGT
jgi:hypothetical protein